MKLLATESMQELLSIIGVSEAVDVEPFLIEHGMAATAQTQIFTELMNLLVAAALAKTRR